MIQSQILPRLALRGALMAVAFFAAGAARADLTLDLRGGNFQPLKIAIADCVNESQVTPVASVITNNLRRSGIFDPIPKDQFAERVSNFDAPPQFDGWRSKGAQALVTCRIGNEGGRLKAEFRLFDITSGEQLVGQQYFTDPASWRRVAHLISDAVYSRVTGEKGFFDTRIVFVDESGPKENRRKRLAVMDQDGANFKPLSGSDSLVVTPRFSPNSQDVTYMGFPQGGGDPKVYLLDVNRGSREVVGNFPGMSFSPRFSPDGRRIVMSLEQNGNANLYAMDIGSRSTTRLTSTGAIDTSPSYSPDGSQIVFESDRGGTQQLYVMGAGGGEGKRISFGDGRYSTPVWSPKGDYIAFTRQKGGMFGIGIMKPDGSGERILTEGFHNEGPTWSPNGRYIIFFRDPGGQAGPKLFMVDITGRVQVPVPTPNYGSDPAWSPLLSETK